MGAYLVIAPDLLGHGRSAKPRGDYSLGAYASGIRDLLLALGDEVHVLLRAATLPLSEFVLPLLASRRRLDAGQWVSRTLGRVGLRAGPDVAEMARGYASLADRGARAAFVHTLRSIVDPSGQRVSARDRLYLASEIPTQIVWGERDPIIPVAHGLEAQQLIPGSRMEVLPDAGHFPMLDDPSGFVRIMPEFVFDTDPAWLEADDLRQRVLQGH